MPMNEAELAAANEKYEADQTQLEADRQALSEQGEPGNKDVKDSALFQKLATENAALKKTETDRQEAADTAAAAAEEKRLKDAGLFDEAAELHKKTVDDLNATHAAELQSRDLETELLKAGASNPNFMRGSVVGYDAEKDGSIADYVKVLKEDETNKDFFGGTVVPTREAQDEAARAAITGAKPNWDKIKVMETSDDRKERIQARAALAQYRKDNPGKPYPYNL